MFNDILFHMHFKFEHLPNEFTASPFDIGFLLYTTQVNTVESR